MSTRSLIALKQKDGSIKSIYCHWDGYLEYNGMILLNYYNDYDKVNKLIDLGNISQLGTNPDATVDEEIQTDTYKIHTMVNSYFSKGESMEHNKPRIMNFKDFNDYCQQTRAGEEYIYFFTPDKNGKYRWLFKEEIHNKKDYGACYQDFYYMSKFKELTQRRINLELVRGYIVHLERIQESKRRCYIYSPEASKYDAEIKEYSDAISEILTENQFKKAMSLYKDYYLKCNNYLRALA